MKKLLKFACGAGEIAFSLVVKSTCSCRSPRFDSQQPHSSPQLSITLVPSSATLLSLGPPGTHTRRKLRQEDCQFHVSLKLHTKTLTQNPLFLSLFEYTCGFLCHVFVHCIALLPQLDIIILSRITIKAIIMPHISIYMNTTSLIALKEKKTVR